MKNANKYRIGIGTFDALKGILIILMIMGHSLSRYTMDGLGIISVLMIVGRLSASGAMPAFYMISGMQFKQKQPMIILKKTFSDLMKPYYITGLFVTLLFPIVYYIRTKWIPAVIQETPHWVLAYALGVSAQETHFFGYRVYECYVAWFLPTMFIGLNLLNLVLRIKKLVCRHLLVAVCVALGFLLAKVGFVYFFLAQGMVALGFCYIGYLGKQAGFFQRCIHPIWVWITLIMAFVLQMMQRPFSMAYINSTGNLWSFFCAIGSAVLMLLLAVRLANSNWVFPEWLEKIGVHSPWIVCIHAVELSVLPWDRLAALLPYPEVVVFLIEMLLKMLIIIPCCMVIKRIHLNSFQKKLERNIR